MRVLIPGGSGQVGTRLAKYLYAAGHEVTVLSRDPQEHPEQLWTTLKWDGLTAGPWASELDRSDAVIHLSGRSINTRFTPENRRQILESRVLPTRLLGKLIAASPTPPRVWINASAVVYYPDPANLPQDEFTPAGSSPAFTDSVTQQWEAALAETPTPRTRKIRLRTSLMMSPDAGGIFAMLSKLARLGLGGTQGPGTQFVSWMHDQDYCRAVELLLARPEIADASQRHREHVRARPAAQPRVPARAAPRMEHADRSARVDVDAEDRRAADGRRAGADPDLAPRRADGAAQEWICIQLS